MIIDYLIKKEPLKDILVSEAVKAGKFKELAEIRKFLVSSFEKNPKFRERILNGIISIDSHILPIYTEELKKFQLEFSKDKSKFANLDHNKLQNKDLSYLLELNSIE